MHRSAAVAIALAALPAIVSGGSHEVFFNNCVDGNEAFMEYNLKKQGVWDKGITSCAALKAAGKCSTALKVVCMRTCEAASCVPCAKDDKTCWAASTTTVDWTKGFSNKPEDQSMSVTAETKLKFEWQGTHNVYWLPSKKAFDACDFSKAAMVGDTSGTLFDIPKTAGSHEGDMDTLYFACEVGGHCTGGQKLAVSVKLPKVEKPMEGAQTPMAGGKNPWEWSGAFTAPGHTTWTLAKKNGKYADSSMKVYIAETDECGAHGIDEVKANAKAAFAGAAIEAAATGSIELEPGKLYKLQTDATAAVSSFDLELKAGTIYAVFTEHNPVEFEDKEHFLKAEGTKADVALCGADAHAGHDHGGKDSHDGHDHGTKADSHAGHDHGATPPSAPSTPSTTSAAAAAAPLAVAVLALACGVQSLCMA